MDSSIRLGRVFGIPVGVHYSWFLVFFLITMLLSDEFGQGYAGWAAALATSLLFFLSAFALDLIPAQHLIAFAVCSAGLGVLVSWLAITLDAIVFRTYAGAGSYIRLFIGGIFENAGFRQLKALCSVPRLPRSKSAQTTAGQQA